MRNKVGYIRVQNDLKKMIVQEKYIIGDLLPSENKLSEQYGLSRMTIRNALRNLEVEGLIYRRQGKGSIVKYKQKSIELLSIKGFTEVMKGKEVNSSTIFIQEPSVISWANDFYWNLTDQELKLGCIHFSRVRKIENQSIMFEETFVSNSQLSDFCNQVFHNDSLFDTLLINYNIEIKSVTQKFRAISASKNLALQLNIDEGAPVLEIMRKLSTSNIGLFIYSFAYCNTDDFIIEA